MSMPTVAGRIREQLAELSPAERKVARALLADYPALGLQTVSEFAQRAQVSGPTVLRFVARLDYDSYPGLQAALLREIQEQLGSPLRRITGAPAPTPAGLLNASARSFVDIVATTFDALPDADLAAATALLADGRNRIHLVGGRFSGVLADYLSAHLALLRSGARVLPAGAPERRAATLDLGRRDVLVAFDYRRYDPGVIDIVARAKQQGARVLLFTDTWLSPAADAADVVLPARVEAYSAFDSLAPAMALVETLVAALAERLGPAANRRMAEIESPETES